MTARVVIDQTCATCGGSGLTVWHPEPGIGEGTECPTCDGRGTVVTAVSCSGCRFLIALDGGEYECDIFNAIVEPTFGCASWEPIRQNATTSDTSETT